MQHLKQKIGIIGASLLVLNGLIGAGIFALPQKLFNILGNASPLIFPVLGILMLCIVQCFSQLAKRIEGTGGPVLYTHAAFGKFVSFQTGWLFYLARATAIAANAHVLLLYLNIEAWGINVNESVIAVVTGLTITFINMRSISTAMRFLDGFTALKLVPIVGILVVGAFQADIEVTFAIPSQTEGLTTAVLLALYAFIGFETVVVTGDETKDAKNTIPKALTYTVIAIALLYTLIQCIYIGVVQHDVGNAAPLVAFANIVAGEVGAIIMAFAAVFSIAANIMANMISTSRLTYSMAINDEIPSWFGKLHPRHATPHCSAWFLGGLACLLSLTGGFVWLAVVSVLSRMTVYLLSILSLIKLKHYAKSVDVEKRTNRLIDTLTPYLSVVIIGFVITQTNINAWLILTFQFLIGVGVYWLWKRYRINGQTA